MLQCMLHTWYNICYTPFIFNVLFLVVTNTIRYMINMIKNNTNLINYNTNLSVYVEKLRWIFYLCPFLKIE